MHTTYSEPSMNPSLSGAQRRKAQRRNVHGAAMFFLGAVLFLLVVAALV